MAYLPKKNDLILINKKKLILLVLSNTLFHPKDINMPQIFGTSIFIRLNW